MIKKSVDISDELWKKFKRYSNDTGANFSNVIRIALKDFLDKRNY